MRWCFGLRIKFPLLCKKIVSTPQLSCFKRILFTDFVTWVCKIKYAYYASMYVLQFLGLIRFVITTSFFQFFWQNQTKFWNILDTLSLFLVIVFFVICMMEGNEWKRFFASLSFTRIILNFFPNAFAPFVLVCEVFKKKKKWTTCVVLFFRWIVNVRVSWVRR